MASTEYGVFNDEGLVEGQFYDVTSANAAAVDMDDENAYVSLVCESHTDQPYGYCDDCDAEETEDDDDDEEDRF